MVTAIIVAFFAITSPRYYNIFGTGYGSLFLHRGGGDFLRRYREAKGWNRQQLSGYAKVSRTSIRCWENGQKTISRKCFDLLVENLGSDFPSMLRM